MTLVFSAEKHCREGRVARSLLAAAGGEEMDLLATWPSKIPTIIVLWLAGHLSTALELSQGLQSAAAFRHEMVYLRDNVLRFTDMEVCGRGRGRSSAMHGSLRA